jgi:hypothetical protein
MQVGVAALRSTDLNGRTLGVAAGDLAAVVGVLVVGLLEHGGDPLAAPVDAALVVGPFVAGWLVASLATGAYTVETLASPTATLLLGLAAWVPAALIGVAIRATPTAPGHSPPIFVAVITASGALGMLLWRGAVAAATWYGV